MIMPRIGFTSRLLLLALFCAGNLSSASPARSPEVKWMRVNSAHFSILTDGGEKNGREVSLRLEQMRDIFAQLFLRTKLQLSEPLDVIALKSDEEYIRVAPLRQGQPISAPGFFLSGEDRNYIVLDLSAGNSWRAVSHDFARMLLHFNYPPTQEWFDEGFAQYFSSLHLEDTQASIGGDPMQNVPWDRVLPGQSSAASDPAKSFVELLNRPWLPMPDLFTMRAGSAGYPPMFYAQSWMVMHSLLNQNKLSEAGTYFGLVKIKKVPVEQAIQQAFGMSAEQFGQAVKDYFHSLPRLSQPPQKTNPQSANSSGNDAHQFPAPLGAGDVGSSIQDVPDAQARALLAEMSLRLPEHRAPAGKDLKSIVGDSITDNAVAHRALAWASMERKEFEPAGVELARAAELDARDPWVRFYLALLKFRYAQSSKQPLQGVSNMIQDLLAVLDWNPEFAEARNLLALARLQGGGIRSAKESIEVAIKLSPCNEQYLLNLAQIELAAKQWDEATLLFDRLKGSLDPQIAQAARQGLEDLPILKQYGVLPQSGGSPGAGSSAHPTSHSDETEAQKDAGSDQSEAAPAEPTLDTRKTQFLRGKLISVDCSQDPVAIVTIRTSSRTMKLRTSNYKSLLTVGAEEFSCQWANRPVVVNYKAGGKTDGDLVSVELQ
jgi:tetratricopeptide (TPR) repeat protein